MHLRAIKAHKISPLLLLESYIIILFSSSFGAGAAEWEWGKAGMVIRKLLSFALTMLATLLGVAEMTKVQGES